MYLLPSRIKTKYRPCRQFYNMPRLSKRSQNMEEEPSSGFIALGRGTVDDLGLEPKSPKINSYTLYILVNVPMISQNIRFKPF